MTHRANLLTSVQGPALISEPTEDITELWLLDRFVDLFGKLNYPFF